MKRARVTNSHLCYRVMWRTASGNEVSEGMTYTRAEFFRDHMPAECRPQIIHVMPEPDAVKIRRKR